MIVPSSNRNDINPIPAFCCTDGDIVVRFLAATRSHDLGLHLPSPDGFGGQTARVAHYIFRQEFFDMAADFFLGESLVGDGNEVAHIDLIIGSKSGPAGTAFTNALANNKDGFTTLLAVVAPNLPAKPDTLLFNKVTIKGAKQAVQMFGPAQAAVARAVVDSVASGVIPKDKADDLCILVGVFIHWDASDDNKIYDFNYQATKESIARALGRKPTVDEVVSGSKSAKHPYSPK
jgi:5,6,7,8-tetrahydromethanopterin hydro-lyase